MRKQPSLNDMQKQVDDFNEHYQVGEHVLVKLDNHELVEDVTVSAAQILSGHTPVVMLRTKGMYLLDRVRKKPIKSFQQLADIIVPALPEDGVA